MTIRIPRPLLILAVLVLGPAGLLAANHATADPRVVTGPTLSTLTRLPSGQFTARYSDGQTAGTDLAPTLAYSIDPSGNMLAINADGSLNVTTTPAGSANVAKETGGNLATLAGAVSSSRVQVTQQTNAGSDAATSANIPLTVPGFISSAGGNPTNRWASLGFVGNTGIARNNIPPVAIVVDNGATLDSLRTPTTCKSASATAAGNTALWTPTSAKKPRVMRFLVEVTGNATLGSAAVLTVGLQDATTDLGLSVDVYVPAAATNVLGGFSSGWIDIGNGKLAAAANDVINVNLSAALTAGNARVIVCGTEE